MNKVTRLWILETLICGVLLLIVALRGLSSMISAGVLVIYVGFCLLYIHRKEAEDIKESLKRAGNSEATIANVLKIYDIEATE